MPTTRPITEPLASEPEDVPNQPWRVLGALVGLGMMSGLGSAASDRSRHRAGRASSR